MATAAAPVNPNPRRLSPPAVRGCRCVIEVLRCPLIRTLMALSGALPPRTRMYIGLGGMAFAMAGLYVSDAMEDKLDPAKRQARETASLVEPANEPRK
ncbi:hypothetical protein BGZ92_011264 [Podila epicladia]|nr:hypothetical protein BGZ92_011264 [Podila epicladia]